MNQTKQEELTRGAAQRIQFNASALSPLRDILLLVYPRASDLYPWPIFFLLCIFVASGPSTQSAALSAKSSVDQILDALDVRGENLQGFLRQGHPHRFR